MKQALLIKVVMGILLVLNVSLLAFIFTQQQAPRGPRAEGRKGKEPVPELLSRTLSLTPEQKESLKKLGRKHHEGLMDMDRDQGTTMLNYFSMKNKGVADEITEDLLNQILEIEKEKILYTHQHFEDIKSLCTEEQIQKFPEVLEIIFNQMNRRNNRRGRPGGPPRGPRPNP